MRTRFWALLATTLLMSLTSCGHSIQFSNNTDKKSDAPSSFVPPSSSPEITTTPNQSTSSSKDEHIDDSLSSIAFSESPIVGNTLNLIAKDKEGTDIENQNLVTYKATKGSELVSLVSNKVRLLNPGEVTIKGSYKGESVENSFVIEPKDTSDNILSIEDAKKKALDSIFSIKGKVLYAKGTDAYIADETSGIFISNWISDSSDTAINEGSFKTGEFVQIKAKLVESKETNTLGQLELTNSIDGKRIDSTYAKKIEADIKPVKPELLDITSFNKLTSKDSGNLYSFKAQYISGEVNKDSVSHLRFVLDYKEIFLDIDSKESNNLATMKFSSDSVYEITTPLYWSNGARFALLDGVSKITFSNKNSLSVALSEEPIVTNTIFFLASIDGHKLSDDEQTKVKYNYVVVKKGQILKSENRATMKSPGEVIMSASYELNGIINTCAFLFNIKDLVDVTKIKDINSKGPYLVKGQVVALTKKGFMVSDGTGNIYVEISKRPTVKVDNFVSIKGSTFRYENQAWQFTESAIITTENEGTAVNPVVSELTPEIADSFVNKVFETTDVKLYSWEATAITNISYTTLNLEGSKTVFRPVNLDKNVFSLESGKKYKIEAYVNGYYSTDNYAPIILTKASKI